MDIGTKPEAKWQGKPPWDNKQKNPWNEPGKNEPKGNPSSSVWHRVVQLKTISLLYLPAFHTEFALLSGLSTSFNKPAFVSKSSVTSWQHFTRQERKKKTGSFQESIVFALLVACHKRRPVLPLLCHLSVYHCVYLSSRMLPHDLKTVIWNLECMFNYRCPRVFFGNQSKCSS